MSRLLLAVLIGLAAGFVGGLAIQGHRASAAESRAHLADSLYHIVKAQDAIAQRERDAFDQLHRLATAHADSVQAAADDSVAAVRARAARTTARASTALAQARTLRDTADTYHSLYVEAASERDDALRAAEDQRRAAGELRAMVAADSVELGKERRHTADWKRAADSLHLANADLLAHRRPSFNLKLGLGGFLSGAVTATVVCVATKRCG